MTQRLVGSLIIAGITLLLCGCAARSGNPGPAARAASTSAVGAAKRSASGDATPARRLALRAARMLDVRTGTTSMDAVVLIEGERITAAGSGLSIPAGTKVIELGALSI